VGGRRELSMRCCPRGSNGSLLLRQNFKAEDRTETDDSTTGRGADI